MLPEFLEFLVEEVVSLASSESEVGGDDLLGDGLGSLLVQVELSIRLSSRVALERVFGDEGVHKLVISGSGESLGNLSVVVMGSVVLEGESTTDSVGIGRSGLGSPGRLFGVGSEL